MGIFQNETEAKLEKIFKTSDLEVIVWQEPISAVAPKGASFVDVVVTVADPYSLTDDNVIALGYAKANLNVRGAQAIRDGETRVFKKVPVLDDDVLFIAMDDDMGVSVDVVPDGSGKVPPKVEAKSPGAEFLGGLGKGIGTGAIAVGALLIVALVFKDKLKSVLG